MRFLVRLAGAGLIAILAACNSVPIEDCPHLGRRLMQFDANDLEVAYQNKVLASREVSGGRPGHAAGGGCG
jgi:hypothetical protein